MYSMNAKPCKIGQLYGALRGGKNWRSGTKTKGRMLRPHVLIKPPFVSLGYPSWKKSEQACGLSCGNKKTLCRSPKHVQGLRDKKKVRRGHCGRFLTVRTFRVFPPPQAEASKTRERDMKIAELQAALEAGGSNGQAAGPAAAASLAPATAALELARAVSLPSPSAASASDSASAALIEALQAKNAELVAEVQSLQASLEEVSRKGKRQSAPFGYRQVPSSVLIAFLLLSPIHFPIQARAAATQPNKTAKKDDDQTGNEADVSIDLSSGCPETASGDDASPAPLWPWKVLVCSIISSFSGWHLAFY